MQEAALEALICFSTFKSEGDPVKDFLAWFRGIIKNVYRETQRKCGNVPVRKGARQRPTESLGSIDEDIVDHRFTEDRLIDKILERDDERSTEAARDRILEPGHPSGEC